MNTLSEIRGNLGLSQVQMAKKIGVHPNSYQRIEQGKRNPTRQQLRAAVLVGFIGSLGKLNELEKYQEKINGHAS